MEQMSVTRGLVELKRLDARIKSAVLSGQFVGRTVGKNNFRKVVGVADSVEAVSAKIQSSFDSVDSLIANRERIKSAIVLSNATTQVTVLGRGMTVAEAIELKSSVDYRQAYLNQLRQQLTRESVEVEKANAALDATIEVSLNNIYGAEKSKIAEDTYASVANPQKNQKEAALLDPMGISARIQKLTEDISNIESELDFTLSESNARTMISV